VCFLTACGQKTDVVNNVEVGASESPIEMRPFSGLNIGMTIDEASEVLGGNLHESESEDKLTDENGKTTSKKWKSYSCAYQVFSVEGELTFVVPNGQESVSEIKWAAHTEKPAMFNDNDVKEFISQVKALYDAEYNGTAKMVRTIENVGKMKSFVWEDAGKETVSLEVAPYCDNKKFERTDKLEFRINIK